jgi:hypothetical protein
MEFHPVEGVLADAVPRLEHDLSVGMGLRVPEQPLVDVQPVRPGLWHRRLVSEHHRLDRGVDGRLTALAGK